MKTTRAKADYKVLSIVISERLVTRSLGFAFGMFVFGQPLLMHLKIELDQAWPTWKIDLILRAYVFALCLR
jgi:hypothetical protein